MTMATRHQCINPLRSATLPGGKFVIRASTSGDYESRLYGGMRSRMGLNIATIWTHKGLIIHTSYTASPKPDV